MTDDAGIHQKVGNGDQNQRSEDEWNRQGEVQNNRKSEHSRLTDSKNGRREADSGQRFVALGLGEEKHADRQTQNGTSTADVHAKIQKAVGSNVRNRLSGIECFNVGGQKLQVYRGGNTGQYIVAVNAKHPENQGDESQEQYAPDVV